MAKRDFYEVLGVPRNSSADEIKKAYRRLARQYHPDVNKTAGSEEKFKEINEAYSVLGDQNKRAQYDRFGSAGPGFGGPGGFSGADFDFSQFSSAFEGFDGFGDIFDAFFGKQTGRRPEQETGEDLRFDLSLTLEEAAAGPEKEIQLNHFIRCKACSGTGAKSGTKPETCPACKGTGQLQHVQRTILGSFRSVTPCMNCRGTGKVIKQPCPTCKGSGRVRQKETLKVKIPAGIDDGYRLRVSGGGDAGVRGGPPGDLYVFVRVEKHKIFERDGADLYYKTKISFPFAALGGEIEVPTLSGPALKLKIPQGTQPNSTFRFKGKGLPILGHHGNGDLYVLVEISTPTNLTHEQIEILKRFSSSRQQKA